MMKMKTIVYVDAFNLYYGALKGTPHKWLDLIALCRVMIPTSDVIGIKYFTAKVHPRNDDQGQPVRQQMYLRALKTIPNLQLIYGHYLSHVVWMPLANPELGRKPFAQVVKTDEKGSDVNLASHLLLDAFDGAFDCAVIISGDSDLKTPVQFVANRFKKIVGVLNPQKNACKALQSTATFYKHIRSSAVESSQFPALMSDEQGLFHKPETW